jgi:CubicO group peptidase (beta-lactamase class C family)
MVPRATVTADAARDVVRRAIDAGAFPTAAVDVGGSTASLWREGFATAEDTPFDLASLTKPIATTCIALQLVHEQRLGLEDRLVRFFSDWRGADREAVTVRDLLEHTSGLAARLVDAAPDVRREFEHDICTMPLEYTPRTTSVYSDIGFILLGFLLADLQSPLDVQFEEIRRRIAELEPDCAPLTFALDDGQRRRAAPTRPIEEDPRRGRLLRGEVHDNYAAALGGVAGHAGLFGTARSVGAFARAVLRVARGDATMPAPLSPSLVRLAVTKSSVPGSSRALGWDTMLPTSSCGTRMSASAFGHVGFTGTSLWIDPPRDRYFVLLTNRACGGGTLDQMRDVRRAFHDALD